MKSVLDSEGHLWTVDSVQNQSECRCTGVACGGCFHDCIISCIGNVDDIRFLVFPLVFELSSTDITMRVISANQALSSPWGIAADSMGNIWMR